jgi:hypothetical protein
MLTYREKIRHYHQLGEYNCGPVALSCLFDNSISSLEELVECKQNKGTYTSKVVEAMKDQDIPCTYVKLIESAKNHMWWLELQSYRWAVYVGCHFVNQGARGRPSNSHHAVLFANGFCYDGNNHREEPISAISQKFNKQFIINSVVIFDGYELPNWRKNLDSALETTTEIFV